MSEQYREVLRSFEADGTVLKAGDIVDVTGWKNMEKLISMRYLGSVRSAGQEPQVKKAAPAKKAVAKTAH